MFVQQILNISSSKRAVISEVRVPECKGRIKLKSIRFTCLLFEYQICIGTLTDKGAKCNDKRETLITMDCKQQ